MFLMIVVLLFRVRLDTLAENEKGRAMNQIERQRKGQVTR